MLKVLHVISGDLWGGAEAQAYTLISHLQAMPGIEAAAAVMNEGDLAARLRDAGVRVLVLDEHHRSPIGIFLNLRRLMADWRPNVVHTHREKENVLGAVANWSAGRVPSLRTVHGGPEHHVKTPGLRALRRRMIEWLDRWCARRLQDRLIVVSRELASRLSDALPPEKMIVIENGIDARALLAQARVAEFRAAEPGCVHVGIVGRLVPVKRVDLFLQTAAVLAGDESARPRRFHIFGDGPLRTELEAMSHRLGTARTVTFHGHRRDIATCIAGLDALVMCSDHEGMPMTALEASVLGVPLIAHAVGALPNIAPKEFLVIDHNAAAYARAVRNALRSDGRAIAQSAAEQVLACFSAEANAQRVRALYEELVSQAGIRPLPQPILPLQGDGK